MFLELIKKRRSIRKFRNENIPDHKVDLLIEAALRAPSSRSLNPWKFIIISEREMLEKLSMAKQHGSSFLKGATLGIVVCADPERCDVWIEDASIASIYIHLMAESLGLGSCWIQIRERMHSNTKTSEDYVSELLNIPENIRVESIIGIGYPDENKSPHKKEELEYGKVFFNSYGATGE